MIQLLRRGYGVEFAAFLLIAILLGSGVAWGTAAALDAAFGDAVGRLLGQAGEYDVIVHLREEAAEGSLPVLRELVLSRFPGATLQEGVQVAGNYNVFIALPEQERRQEVFEELPALFAGVTGYNGLTWIVEPSLTVSGVRSGVDDVLLPRFSSIDGVRFTFRDGSRLILVLDDPARVPEAAAAVQAILDDYRILELRWAEGRAESAAAAFWESLTPAEQQSWTDLTRSDESSRGLEGALDHVSRILELYASKVWPSPQADLREGDRIVLQGRAPKPPEVGSVLDDPAAAGYVVAEITSVEGGRPLGRIVVGDASDLVSVGPGRYVEVGYRLEGRRVGASVGPVTVESPRYALEAAVRETGNMIERVQRLAGQVEQVGAAVAGNLSTWVKAVLQLGGAPAAASPASPPFDVGLGDTRAQLDALQREVSTLELEQMQELGAAVRGIGESLPSLRDEALSESLLYLDRHGFRSPLWGETLELLVPASVSPQQVRERAEKATGSAPLVSSYVAGVLNPNPRATLLHMLTQVRQALAGVVAIGLVVFLLWADGATLLHAGDFLARVPGWGRAFRAGKKPPRLRRIDRVGAGTVLWGCALGSGLLLGIVALAGGQLPGLTLAHLAVLGAALGALTALLSPRLSPLNADEVEAGVALGLGPADVMREIIVPEGRPGILSLINRWRRRNP